MIKGVRNAYTYITITSPFPGVFREGGCRDKTTFATDCEGEDMTTSGQQDDVQTDGRDMDQEEEILEINTMLFFQGVMGNEILL